MESNATYTFSKEERLKSRKMIDLLFTEGKQFSVYPLKVFWIAKNNIAPLQTGVGVSSRYFKKATDRNRIKRLMRESYRLEKNDLKNLLHTNEKQLSVFILYTGKEIPEYKLIAEKMEHVIQRLTKIVNEKPE